MKIQPIAIGATLLLLTACQTGGMGGGNGMPTITRTGEVKDIVIRDTVSPETVTVNPGDEIRWVNKRQGDARVIFLTQVQGQLSCQRGFGGLTGGNINQYTAKLDANQTASVCFKNPTDIKYVVRAVSNDPSGEINFPGSISIRGEQQQSSQSDQKTGQVLKTDSGEIH
jgi:plastocyanin